MSAAVWIFFLLVGTCVVMSWYNNHPAVRLKRRMRASMKAKERADQEIDRAYHHARSEMGRIARNWKNR